MAQFIVNWKYKSSLGGPWAKGDVIDLDEATAGAVNLDSPGVLALKGKGKGKNRMAAAEETRDGGDDGDLR